MGNEINTKQFSGHQGFVVKDTNTNGVLDAGDEVRKLVVDEGVKGRVDTKNDKLSDTPVAFDDPEFAAARRDFVDKRAAVDGLWSKLQSASKPGAKPPEATFRSLAENARQLSNSNAAPRLRGEAEQVWSAAMGIIARDYCSWFLSKADAGAEGYRAIKSAALTDPTNERAWAGLAIAWLLTNEGVKSWGDMGLSSAKKKGVDIVTDGPLLVAGLNRFPEDATLQLYLKAVLDAQQQAGRAVDPGVRDGIDARLQSLTARDPAAVASARARLDEYGKSAAAAAGK